MAEPVPAGSDVSAVTYECTNCGNGEYQSVTGGDSAGDSYPDA